MSQAWKNAFKKKLSYAILNTFELMDYKLSSWADRPFFDNIYYWSIFDQYRAIKDLNAKCIILNFLF